MRLPALFDRRPIVRGLAKNSAKYRAVVLQACQQVEDNLALTHHLGDEADRQQEALDAAERTLALSMSRYRDGVVSYLVAVQEAISDCSSQAGGYRT